MKCRLWHSCVINVFLIINMNLYNIIFLDIIYKYLKIKLRRLIKEDIIVIIGIIINIKVKKNLKNKNL